MQALSLFVAAFVPISAEMMIVAQFAFRLAGVIHDTTLESIVVQQARKDPKNG